MSKIVDELSYKYLSGGTCVLKRSLLNLKVLRVARTYVYGEMEYKTGKARKAGIEEMHTFRSSALFFYLSLKVWLIFTSL